MDELLKPSTFGFAGFKTLHFALTDDFSSFPKYNGLNILESDIVFKLGKAWRSLYFTPGTLQPDEKPKQSEGGQLKEYSIKLNYPSDSKETTEFLESIREAFFVLKIEDMNGNKRLYGSTDLPFGISFNLKKGSTPGGAKHYEIEFNGTMLISAPYIV